MAEVGEEVMVCLTQVVMAEVIAVVTVCLTQVAMAEVGEGVMVCPTLVAMVEVIYLAGEEDINTLALNHLTVDHLNVVEKVLELSK
jgi:hypothetical protein